MPAFTEPAVQKVLAAASADFISLRCSNSLVKMMYQLAMLMMTMMISVPRATKSPCDHSADRP